MKVVSACAPVSPATRAPVGRGVRVCLVTTGQPSTNPRLTKEANALTEAGYQVHVVGAHWADWADITDTEILSNARWSVELIDWRPDHSPSLFQWSRARHWLARTAARSPLQRFVPAEAALSRVGPELTRAARRIPAELYVAHNLGALPAAHAAAREHHGLLGFDAEDFHSGQLSETDDLWKMTVQTESSLLKDCTYVTAAAPGIARAYSELYGLPLPTCVLNVFSLNDRPVAFRPTDVHTPLRLYWFSQTIGPNRGLEDAVQAMGLLARHSLELHLRGRWQHGYEERLRALAERAGVAQARVVSHEPASPAEMVRCAAQYDIGLALEPVASRNNDLALSNKVFTYLLAGNAVLASLTSGQAEILPQLEGAAVGYAPADPAALAAAIRPWLENRPQLDAARRAAWRLGETRFNWEAEKHTLLSTVRVALAAQVSGTCRVC